MAESLAERGENEVRSRCGEEDRPTGDRLKNRIDEGFDSTKWWLVIALEIFFFSVCDYYYYLLLIQKRTKKMIDRSSEHSLQNSPSSGGARSTFPNVGTWSKKVQLLFGVPPMVFSFLLIFFYLFSYEFFVFVFVFVKIKGSPLLHDENPIIDSSRW